MIHLTRVIEYEYETVDLMVKDIANWTLPDRKWFPFGKRKRGWSRVSDYSWSDETITHADLSKAVNDALAKTPRIHHRDPRGVQ